MSGRVVWAHCPGCGQSAAIGLVENAVVEFDCPAGCELPREEMAELRRRFRLAWCIDPEHRPR